MKKDIFRKFHDAMLQLEGTEKIDVPLEEIVGVPQRSYGHTGGKVKYLQTGNVNYCTALFGHNDHGSFLAHLDKCCFERNQVPEMMVNLDRALQGPFDMTLVYNKGDDERQQFIPTLKKLLLPFQRKLCERRKGSLQILNLGIDLTGRIYYPGTNVANEAHDELESWFFVRRGEGNAPEGYYREDLGCVNTAKGVLIPKEAFVGEQTYHWVRLKATREEVIEHVDKLFPVTCGDYVEMAQGRPPSIPEENGALILV